MLRAATLILLLALAGCGGSDSSLTSPGGEPDDPPGGGVEPRAGILVVDGGDLFLVDPDGGGRERLTRTPESESDPAWSPDGRRIAFVRRPTGGQGAGEVYVVSADGSGEANLSRHAADDRDPSWSRDGRRIAFVSDRDGNDEVYAVDVGGAGPRNLTSAGSDDTSPRFLPDGRIAFLSSEDGAIYVANGDGSGRRRLPDVTAGPPLSFAVSPDGGRFAAQAPSFNGMVIAEFDGTVLVDSGQLPVPGDQTGGRPAFSPDGRSIVYGSGEVDWEPAENVNIQRVGLDAPRWERLTEDPAAERDPLYSPDGARIAFTRVAGPGAGGAAEVWVMDADGSNARRLTSGALGDWR